MELEEDLFLYDEDEAVKFIQNHLPQELKEKLNEDTINYVIDVVYEFYESKGFLKEDADEEVEIDEDEIVAFVMKNAAKNNIGSLTEDEVRFIIQGELAYCDSLGIFE